VLLAVPNFSEGRDEATIAAIAAELARGAAVLDLHSDPVHNRSVVTLSAPRGELAGALETGARACVERIDLTRHEGAHPRIGALDVCPVVFLDAADREQARAEALVAAEAIAALGVPVFLYGELAREPGREERAYFRRGGPTELARRMSAGELLPDLGPARANPTAGATLVTARAPLAAFNLLLDTSDVEVAGAVAAGLRESGGGLPGVRAIGIDLDGIAQVSINVHDPVAIPLAAVIERVRELAARRAARPVSGEVIGLLPEAAIRDLPDDLPVVGFDPALHVIERRLSAG
jgi:glutamate formiminotransferase / 5-formyltetrahydrofolate cyclo-ligase